MVSQQTSLMAYSEIKMELGERQEEVYNLIKSLGSVNNMIIARRLALPINSVTPRVYELRELGLVEKDCMRACPISKRITWFWRIRK